MKQMISKKDKATLETMTIQARSTLTSDENRSIFEVLVNEIITNYEEGKTTRIPLVGDLSIEKKGDQIIEGKKFPKYKITIEPNDFLLHDLAIIENSLMKIPDTNELYVVKLMKEKLEQKFYEKIGE